MAGNLTNYAEDLILKWLGTAQTATRPTTWYLALFTAAPGEAGGGTEVTGSGYARQAVNLGTDGKANTAQITFVATGNWPNPVTHLAIMDASSAGNMLWYAPLASSRTIDNGDQITWAIGALTLALD